MSFMVIETPEAMLMVNNDRKLSKLVTDGKGLVTVQTNVNE